MREILLLRQINQSYRILNLKYSRLLLAFVLMFLTALLEMSGLSILYPLVLALGSEGQSVNSVFSYLPFTHPFLQDSRNQMLVLFAAIGLVYVAKNVALYFSYRYNINFAMYYYRHLIRGLYDAYVHKSLVEFRKESPGSLSNIICVQTSKLVDGVVRPLMVMITEFIILIAISLLLFFVTPVLTIVLIITCAGAAAVYYVSLRQRALDWGKQRMEAATTLQELVNNTSVGITDIKVSGREDYLTERVYQAAIVETDMFRNLEMYQQGPRFLIETVFTLTFVGSFVFSLVAGADLTVLLAGFSVIAAASFRLLPSINRIFNSYSNFSFHVGPAISLMQTISELHLLRKSDSHFRLTDVAKREVAQIELKDVSFEYPGAPRPVLRNVQAVFKRGQRIGIMGLSGSGKSTLIEILAGLYERHSGALLIDGFPVSAAPRAWQAVIGYVPQVPFIMPGTIRENVTFGATSSVDENEIFEVLGLVGASFVFNLPNGIDTEIGEKRAGLSGGQKQLICLARALLRKPKLLLLDEPTAALDRQSELMVLESIRALPGDRIIVMVSHKLDNFERFDVLYRCEDGKLIETPLPDSMAGHASKPAHSRSI
jgi:ATP-binding cassette, subfamily B, bacterial PglK